MAIKRQPPVGFGPKTHKVTTVIRDPRRSPQRNDTVILANEVLTVEFVNDMGLALHLVGYRTTGIEKQKVVELSIWRAMCADADGAIDPNASYD
jgi:hypothetical protein